MGADCCRNDGVDDIAGGGTRRTRLDGGLLRHAVAGELLDRDDLRRHGGAVSAAEAATGATWVAALAASVPTVTAAQRAACVNINAPRELWVRRRIRLTIAASPKITATDPRVHPSMTHACLTSLVTSPPHGPQPPVGPPRPPGPPPPMSPPLGARPPAYAPPPGYPGYYPPANRWPVAQQPVASRRPSHTKMWVGIAIGALVIILIPVLSAAAAIGMHLRAEHQPPQSTYDDARDVADVVSRQADQGLLPATVAYRSEGGVLHISGDILKLGKGNRATVSGTSGAWCVAVSHRGARTVYWDSVWDAAQHGTSATGACR